MTDRDQALDMILSDPKVKTSYNKLSKIETQREINRLNLTIEHDS